MDKYEVEVRTVVTFTVSVDSYDEENAQETAQNLITDLLLEHEENGDVLVAEISEQEVTNTINTEEDNSDY
jgi:hypothetical protein